MGKTDPRFEEYIDKSPDFAKPVLTFFRELVHQVCPDVEEVIKWQFPCFVYKKQILCSMAAFKGHCSSGLIGRIRKKSLGKREFFFYESHASKRILRVDK